MVPLPSLPNAHYNHHCCGGYGLQMNSDIIAFIGGGQMAAALAGGLRAGGVAPAALRIAEPSAGRREWLQLHFAGVAVHAGNEAAADGAAAWVLAVKPQQLAGVAKNLAPLAARQRPLVISVAAGVRIASLRRWLGPGPAIVRCMPNRPALVGAGITGLHAGADVPRPARDRAERILGAVGECVWVEDEALLDAVTAVSGSGPAYVFLLVEMLEEAARAEGLDPAVARRLAVGTVAGAARLAGQHDAEPAALRDSVTSPGGTTAAALEVLEAAGIRQTFMRAVHAARLRSAELAGPAEDR